MNIRLVGIIVRPDSPSVQHVAEELAAWFDKRQVKAEIDAILPDMDMLVILGGDGTLLHVASQASELDIPVVGINLGDLGFLTEIAADEMYQTLETVLAGKVQLEKRMMLSASIIKGVTGAKSQPIYSLNEVVIVRDNTERVLRLCCWSGSEYITTYKTDGLIMSTPTGSTAYNLSAGGPIVHAELNTILVTPICPFMLESRPVLLDPKIKLTAQLLAPVGGVKVIIDGEQQWQMTDRDFLQVEMAGKPLQLISSPVKSYFTILRNKLNWGGSREDLPLPSLARKFL